MRLDEQVSVKANKPQQNSTENKTTKANNKHHNTVKANKPKSKKVENAAMGNAFADAFAKLKK